MSDKREWSYRTVGRSIGKLIAAGLVPRDLLEASRQAEAEGFAPGAIGMAVHAWLDQEPDPSDPIRYFLGIVIEQQTRLFGKPRLHA